MPAILKVRNITKRFGPLLAVNNCSLDVEFGLICGLIGPNGAGKSTLFNIIAGTHQPDDGSIHLNEFDVTGLPAHKMFAKGLIRTFQIPHEYSNLTAVENLLMVPPQQLGEKLSNALFRPSHFHKQEQNLVQKANEVIDFIGLGQVKNELAGNLSGGQKKLLELGRSLMVESNIVLLDELGAGVNHTLLNTLSDNIIRLNREFNRTFFIIEHNMDFISKLCHRVLVMIAGEVEIEGTPQEVLSNPQVVDAYFGGGEQIKRKPGR